MMTLWVPKSNVNSDPVSMSNHSLESLDLPLGPYISWGRTEKVTIPYMLCDIAGYFLLRAQLSLQVTEFQVQTLGNGL